MKIEAEEARICTEGEKPRQNQQTWNPLLLLSVYTSLEFSCRQLTSKIVVRSCIFLDFFQSCGKGSDAKFKPTDIISATAFFVFPPYKTKAAIFVNRFSCHNGWLQKAWSLCPWEIAASWFFSHPCKAREEWQLGWPTLGKELELPDPGQCSSSH